MMSAPRWFALVFAAAVLHLSLPFIAAVDYQSNDDNQFEWGIITADNFSSQIRLHPYVILLVTVPWCGESRSLMREISRKLTKEQHEFSSVKLMVLHRNLDKVLANSLDAAEGISVLCYHHAVSYRYLGSLRAQEILSSVHYLMSAAPKELPLKTLNSSEDLDEFLASTDKAVLLLESCGWTYKLLMQHYGNKTLQGGILPELLDEETNSTLASGRHKNLKEVINKMMSSEVEDVCSTSPWVGDFSAENGTTSPTDEDVHPTFGTSCNFEEYKKFESFFLKFVATARDLYLPPQRQRYGLVSQRLLLSPLGLEVSDQWSLIISYAGCPGCLTILKEDNHLHDALERHDLPVVELHDRGEYLGPSLPIDKPSVLLFVDRTSDLVETRRNSQEALHAFKEVALQHWKPNEVDGQNNTWPKRPSLHTHQGSTNMFESHRSLLSPSQKNDKKMSVMIINEGQQVTLNNEALNLEGSSLQEILTHLVVQKNQLKLRLSSLAKEAGFQLVSDDMDLKVADMSSHTQSQHQDSTGNSVETSNEVFNDMNKEEMDKLSPMEQQGEQSQHLSVEAPDTDIDRKGPADVASKESSFLDPGQYVSTDEVVSPLDLDPKIQTYVLSEKSESVEKHFNGVSGSFLFSECNYQLLRSLTNDSKVPRIVIVDPISQEHYVLPEVANLTSKSISTFIEGFLNGTLIPYRRSGLSRNSIKMLQPPFVNFDFHEKDSIPSVTTRMFSELVLGSDGHGDQNATNTSHKDVVVLFSNSWCGFCQRMELVVREVYRAFKGYGNMVNTDSKGNEELSGENFKDNTARLPAFYSIDCTLNDCGGILKSLGQSEVYPTLVLFPAESKTPVPYDGNMMATDVIKFIVNHGSNLDLAKHEGTLWIDGEEREGHDDQFEGTFTSGDNNFFPHREEEYIGANLKNTNSEDQHKFNLNEKIPSVNITLGSFLIATDHLQDGLNPFNKARILIVGANRELGFQGLIVNKPISWNSVQFEDAKLYELLKDAPLSFGGPVIQEGSSFVSLAKSPLNDEYPQVSTGVYFLDPLATVKEIEKIRTGDRNARDYWFFWGYSGWSWDQLFGEVNGGAWATVHEGELNDLQWP